MMPIDVVDHGPRVDSTRTDFRQQQVPVVVHTKRITIPAIPENGSIAVGTGGRHVSPGPLYPSLNREGLYLQNDRVADQHGGATPREIEGLANFSCLITHGA